MILCDLCAKDYTLSDTQGGFLFGNTAVCPTCTPEFRKDNEMFIRLTELSGKDLYLNANKIVEFQFDSAEGKNFTYIIYGPNGARDVARVQETPEEIMQLIKEASK